MCDLNLAELIDHKYSTVDGGWEGCKLGEARGHTLINFGKGKFTFTKAEYFEN